MRSVGVEMSYPEMDKAARSAGLEAGPVVVFWQGPQPCGIPSLANLGLSDVFPSRGNSKRRLLQVARPVWPAPPCAIKKRDQCPSSIILHTDGARPMMSAARPEARILTIGSLSRHCEIMASSSAQDMDRVRQPRSPKIRVTAPDFGQRSRRILCGDLLDLFCPRRFRRRRSRVPAARAVRLITKRSGA